MRLWHHSGQPKVLIRGVTIGEASRAFGPGLRAHSYWWWGPYCDLSRPYAGPYQGFALEPYVQLFRYWCLYMTLTPTSRTQTQPGADTDRLADTYMASGHACYSCVLWRRGPVHQLNHSITAFWNNVSMLCDRTVNTHSCSSSSVFCRPSCLVIYS